MDKKNKVREWGKVVLFLLFVVLSILNFKRIDSVSHSASDTLRPFIIQTIILILSILTVYYLITKAMNFLAKK